MGMWSLASWYLDFSAMPCYSTAQMKVTTSRLVSREARIVSLETRLVWAKLYQMHKLWRNSFERF